MGSEVTTSVRLAGLGRAAWIEVAPGVVRLHLPGVLGQTPWEIPLDHVGVVNMANLELVEDAEDEGPTTIFGNEIRIPYLETGPLPAAPTLCLLFASPARVPPLPRFGISEQLPRRASRSREGVWLDGVCLRAQDAVQAVIDLQAAGAQRVLDPEAWLAARRPVVTDPAQRVAIEQEDLGAWHAGLIFVLGLVLLVAMRIVAAYVTTVWAAVGAALGALLMMTSAIYRWVARRRLRQTLASFREAPRPGPDAEPPDPV